jgi:thiol:disulfide interchange protein DsbA
LFYTLQALGRADLHKVVFDTIHQRGQMLVANDAARTQAMQLDFAKANGIDPEAFRKAYESFSVNAKLQRAEELTRRYRVEGVPLVVVNGKYSTDVGAAGGQAELISLINDLAAAERRR